MKKNIAVLLLAFAVALLGAQSQDLQGDFNLPGSDFNEYVLLMLKSYPTDGTHTYYWPSGGGWAGNTCDLHYLGTLFSAGDPQRRCYCCGLTFEVFFRAYEKYCRDRGWAFTIRDFDSAGLRRFRSQWFGSDGNSTTLQNAIVSNALGQSVAAEDARTGDFVQFWRHSGSGHSVVFIGWVRDSDGSISGLSYWSTQKSTNGIGHVTEYFGKVQGIDRNRVHIARVGR